MVKPDKFQTSFHLIPLPYDKIPYSHIFFFKAFHFIVSCYLASGKLCYIRIIHLHSNKKSDILNFN